MVTISNPSVKRANALLGLQFLSDFGDQITSALLAACLLDITQSAGKVGFVYFITTVGYIVFTLAGGLIGDRLSKRNILVYSDVGRGLVVVLMILALREKSIFLIYCTSFLLAILGSLHRPVKLSIWTESIPEPILERYNSLSEFSIQASSIAGPLIASLFILNKWTNFGFAIDALTFFVCAVVFARMIERRITTHDQSQKYDKKKFLTGFRKIFAQREMAKYVAYDAIQMIGFGAFNATFLVLAQRDFGWSKADYSYHLSIIALFTTLAAFLGATSFIAKVDQIAKLKVCALLSAVMLTGVLHLQSFPIGSILMGICDGLSVLTLAVTRTKIQVIAKNEYPEHLTSIIAARFIIIKLATLLGAGACLLIDDFLSLQKTLALFVVPIGVSFLPFFAKDHRRALGSVAVSSPTKALK